MTRALDINANPEREIMVTKQNINPTSPKAATGADVGTAPTALGNTSGVQTDTPRAVNERTRAALSQQTLDLMRTRQRTDKTTANFTRLIVRQGEDAFGHGRALVVSAAGGMWIGTARTGSHSFTIAIPPEVTASDLAFAMTHYPVPALILEILEEAFVCCRTLSSADLDDIAFYGDQFLDALTRLSSGEAGPIELLKRPT